MNLAFWIAVALAVGLGLALVLIPALSQGAREGRKDRGGDGGFVPIAGDSDRRPDDIGSDAGSDGGGGDGGGGGGD